MSRYMENLYKKFDNCFAREASFLNNRQPVNRSLIIKLRRVNARAVKLAGEKISQ